MVTLIIKHCPKCLRSDSDRVKAVSSGDCGVICGSVFKVLLSNLSDTCVRRSGPLFNTGFLRRMLSAAVKHSMDDIQPLVKTLICESECTTLKSLVHGPSALTNQGTVITCNVCLLLMLLNLNGIFCSSAVECGVVIKTLQSRDESGAADQAGQS